jgi:hypothetical protein
VASEEADGHGAVEATTPVLEVSRGGGHALVFVDVHAATGQLQVWAPAASAAAMEDTAALQDVQHVLQRADRLPEGALRVLQWAHAADAAAAAAARVPGVA